MKFKDDPIDPKQEAIDKNTTHKSILESIHNKDFEKTNGHPHPSSVRKKIDLKVFEKAVDVAVRKAIADRAPKKIVDKS